MFEKRSTLYVMLLEEQPYFFYSNKIYLDEKLSGWHVATSGSLRSGWILSAMVGKTFTLLQCLLQQDRLEIKTCRDGFSIFVTLGFKTSGCFWDILFSFHHKERGRLLCMMRTECQTTLSTTPDLRRGKVVLHCDNTQTTLAWARKLWKKHCYVAADALALGRPMECARAMVDLICEE